MKSDLQSTKDDLARYADVVYHGVRPTLERVETLLTDAMADLAGFDDPSAREARALTISALDLVRTANRGWLNDYVREADELSRRIDDR
jgi:hypothetical protein